MGGYSWPQGIQTQLNQISWLGNLLSKLRCAAQGQGPWSHSRIPVAPAERG